VPRRIGHRGARGYETENTPASFERAIALGCDEIETDVWLVEGRLVISHDPPTSGSTFELADALDLCHGRLTLNVELKARRDAACARATGVAAAKLIDREGSDAYVSSFWWPTLQGARDAAPGVGRAAVYAGYADPGALIAQATSLGLRSLHPAHAYVTAELVRAAHAEGITVNAWTANDPADIAALAALGVDGIISDYPDRVPKG